MGFLNHQQYEMASKDDPVIDQPVEYYENSWKHRMSIPKNPDPSLE